MDKIINIHIKKFKAKPIFVGKYWKDKGILIDEIEKAIINNKPFNEYDLLSDKEKKAFDSGELVF